MCDTCGCESNHTVTFIEPGKENEHQHLHHDREIALGQSVLAENNRLAERNRGFFEAKNILAINLVSSPGSGKTTLLERTLNDLGDVTKYVIEGDQHSMNDANRIHKTGVKAIQVNTGNGCHLDADMVHHAIHQLGLKEDSLLFIENVGNLVCPALFDLGETHRVVLVSVTEGTDKPLKYPYMFASSQLCIINKIDLLPYVDFDVDQMKEYALRVNPSLEFIEISATTGTHLDLWSEWVRSHLPLLSSSCV
jgi:hydrogenase nickel incorporation protein HypB